MLETSAILPGLLVRPAGGDARAVAGLDEFSIAYPEPAMTSIKVWRVGQSRWGRPRSPDGGARGEGNARRFGVYGYTFNARKP